MGHASKRLAARWLTAAVVAVFVVLAVSCSSGPDEHIATSRQAIDLGGCNQVWLDTSSQGQTYDDALELIIPATVYTGTGGGTHLYFEVAILGRPPIQVDCHYMNGTFTSCDQSGFSSGSRVFTQFVSMYPELGGSWAGAWLSYTPNDYNECTSDTCPSGTKTNTAVQNGTFCGQADPCYTASTCMSGVCGNQQALPVDDGDPCTSPDHCDSSRGMWGEPNGQCSVPPGATSTDPTIPTDFSGSVAFIYNGGGQTGVQQGAIDSRRASVVRGRVVDGSGIGIGSVAVKVLNHTELGTAMTRSDGRFDMVVNGGGDLVMDFVGPAANPRYMEVQRRVAAYWHDYTVLDDLVMLRNSTTQTTVHRNVGYWQTAAGDSVNEGSITRRARVFFPPSWDVDAQASGWSNPPPPANDVTFTSVEYTGISPSAMPAALPPQSQYTYASEFAFEEAVAAGVASVKFLPQPDKWAILYTEPVLQANDSENAPGHPVPTGTYDTKTGFWVAEENGRVVEIKSCAQGAEAVQVVAIYNQQQQSDYDAIGMTAAERQQLCAYYSVNTRLWRVRRPHFSTTDLNWAAIDPNAFPPPNDRPKPTTPQDKPCNASGSIIECENQILAEEIPIPGTPYALRYQSDKQIGFWAGYTTRVTPDSWGQSTPPTRIELRTQIAGRYFIQQFATTAGQFHSFAWDRRDGYGREVQGTVTAHIELRYVFAASSLGTAATSSFGRYAAGLYSGVNRAGREIYLSQFYTQEVGVFDAKGFGLGGWSLSPNHVYDPTSGTMFLGNGERRTAKAGGVVATTTVGGGNGPISNGSPANGAQIDKIAAIAMGADGTMYVSSGLSAKIFTVDPVNGTLGTAQSSTCGSPNWTDGAPAVGTCIGTQPYFSGMAVARDDSIYFADWSYDNVYKLSPGPNRTISLVGGGSRASGVCGFSGDGQIAGEGTTKFSEPSGLAVANDGTLYIADTNNGRIRRIGTDHVVETVAGNSTPSSCNDTCLSFPTDGQLATTQPFCHPQSLAIGPDGALYTSVWNATSGRIVKVGLDGIVKTIAGTTALNGPRFDNVPATTANLQYIQGLTFDSAGNLYVFDSNISIRRIDGGGMITTVVDSKGELGSLPPHADTTVQDNQLARSTHMYSQWVGGSSLFFGSDGYLHWSELSTPYLNGTYYAGRVRKVRSLGNFIAAENGSEVYEFDNTGRHASTRRPLRGGIARDFHYTNGLVDTITEYAGGNGNVTSVARSSNLVTITPPFNSSLQTTISLDANSGYATQIAWPTGNVQMTYWTDANGNANGLLKTLRDPNGNIHNFSYQAAGRLQRDTNPLPNSTGTYLTANRTWKGFNLLKQTPEKQTTLFDVDQTSGTDQVARASREIITTDGVDAKLTLDERVDLSKKATLSNNSGTLSSEETFYQTDYKRFGINSPYWSQVKRSNGGITGDELDRTHTVTLTQGGGMFDLTSTEAIKDEVYYLSTPSKKWTSTYDATNNKWISASPTGVKVERRLDSRERPTTIHFNGSNPNTLSDATISYDSQTGRVTGLAQGSRSWTINYGSGTGFVTSIVDNALGRTWTYNQRNGLGRPTQETLPGNRTLGFGWDADGNLTSFTPPKGSSYIHNFTPNSIDLLASYSPPNIGFPPSTSYAYDRDSHMTSVTTPSGTITYLYDYQGRVATKTTGWATVNYSYDKTNGLLASVSATNAPTIQYAYLPNGTAGTLPTKVTYAGMPAGGSPYVEYAYDSRFRLSQRKINGANAINYSYDDDGTLSQIALPGGINFTINRAVGETGTGLITSTQLSGSSPTVQTFGYNQYAELTSLAVTVGGASKYGLTYNRDPGGRIAGTYPNTVGKNENNYGAYPEYDWTYAYDARGFLSTAYLSGGSTQQNNYDYDNHGNLTGGSCPGCFDLHDRMTSSSSYGLSFSYTNNGELSYQTNGWDDSWSYSYDLLGNLRSINRYNWYGGTTTWDYVIDGLDRRIARKVNGTITQQFLYDEHNRIIAELNGSGALVSYFVYATHAQVPDVMVRVVAPTGTYVFIHDQLGSPMMIVSSAGVIAQKRAYGPWGDMWYDNTLLGGFTQPFSFAGGLYDDATGYRFGARDYNPWLGRWYSKDRARFAGGINLYAYCYSDPINCMDPSGRVGGFVWGSFGLENPGPIRGGTEGIAIAGVDYSNGHANGYYGDILASGLAVGGESIYGAAFNGIEVERSVTDGTMEAGPISIYEIGIGPELLGVAGVGIAFGVYHQGDEWGWFQGMHEGALGEHGAFGVGVPLLGEHGLITAFFDLFRSGCK